MCVANNFFADLQLCCLLFFYFSLFSLFCFFRFFLLYFFLYFVPLSNLLFELSVNQWKRLFIWLKFLDLKILTCYLHQICCLKVIIFRNSLCLIPFNSWTQKLKRNSCSSPSRSTPFPSLRHKFNQNIYLLTCFIIWNFFYFTCSIFLFHCEFKSWIFSQLKSWKERKNKFKNIITLCLCNQLFDKTNLTYFLVFPFKSSLDFNYQI